MWMKSQASQASQPENLSHADVGDRGRPADRRERPLVEVAERRERLARERADGCSRGVLALPGSPRRDPGDGWPSCDEARRGRR